MNVCLDVVGIPQPQGSKTAFVRNGRAVLTEGRTPNSREAFKSWRDGVTVAARNWQTLHGQPAADEPVEVRITFRLPRPKSAPKRRIWPDRKPDLDKLIRSVLDALTHGGVLFDDSRVVAIHARKVFAIDGPPGASIEVLPADAEVLT